MKAIDYVDISGREQGLDAFRRCARDVGRLQSNDKSYVIIIQGNSECVQ
jgi:hypothetical protein